MTIVFRATDDFMARVRKDLSRDHPFAHERVGFITVRAISTSEQLVLFAQDYEPVSDSDYLRDDSVGAMIGQEALRKALEIALLHPVGVFHVHQHLFSKRLWFSHTDLREQLRFVPDFFKVRPNMPHGAIVLNPLAAAGRAWVSGNKIEHIAEFNTIGARVDVSRSTNDGSVDFYA
jgi:hypothetical protein